MSASPSLGFRPLAANGEAAWRSGGGHYRSCGRLTSKFARNVLRSYTRHCAKPPVRCSLSLGFSLFGYFKVLRMIVQKSCRILPTAIISFNADPVGRQAGAKPRINEGTAPGKTTSQREKLPLRGDYRRARAGGGGGGRPRLPLLPAVDAPQPKGRPAEAPKGAGRLLPVARGAP